MVKQLKRTMCRFTLVAAIVFIALAGPAAADLEPARLEKTVVTASRTEANLSMVPASVEVVTEEEIEARSANRIRDILKLSTGVNLQQKEPVIRGFKGEHSIVMVDGKRVAGEVSYSFELNRITTENIERIEIVRGPMSAVYGSDALGGIINIITKKPNKFSFKSQAKYGQVDNDGQNQDLSVSYSNSVVD